MDKNTDEIIKQNAAKLAAYIKANEKSAIAFQRRLVAYDVYGKKKTLANVTIGQWCNGSRPIPPDWMPSIEKESGGKVSRKLMHKGWRSLWPELAND